MRSAVLLEALAVAVVASGCLVDVDLVEDPGPAFAAARARAASVQARPGPPERLNVLVHDRGEGRLVRVEVPLSLVRDLEAEGCLDLEGRGEAARAIDRLRSHVRSGRLDRAPLGILAEVEEEGGDQVLVWLE